MSRQGAKHWSVFGNEFIERTLTARELSSAISSTWKISKPFVKQMSNTGGSVHFLKSKKALCMTQRNCLDTRNMESAGRDNIAYRDSSSGI